MNELNKRLSEIQKALKAPKNQYNKFANFYYRNCEDILEGVKPLLGDLSLVINDEVMHIGDRYYVKATVSLTDGENSIASTALARESETKTGMDVAQVTGASSSYARKYALNGLFAIDDSDSGDPDMQNNKTIEVKKPVMKPMMTVSQEQATSAKLTPEDIENRKKAEKATYLYDLWKKHGKNHDEEKAKLFSKYKVNNMLSLTMVDLSNEINEFIKIVPIDSASTVKTTDAEGHSLCASCQKPVNSSVESYSLKQYGRVLCMPCQQLEKK